MTSTWSQSATPATTAASSASRAKSAARMLGAICMVISPASVGTGVRDWRPGPGAASWRPGKCHSPGLPFDPVFESPPGEEAATLISQASGSSEAPSRLLDRVRKLLARAEDESGPPPEAAARTAEAAELMAKCGIDRALLAADRPETDRADNRILDIEYPWARVKAHLLCGLGSALRCP